MRVLLTPKKHCLIRTVPLADAATILLVRTALLPVLAACPPLGADSGRTGAGRHGPDRRRTRHTARPGCGAVAAPEHSHIQAVSVRRMRRPVAGLRVRQPAPTALARLPVGPVPAPAALEAQPGSAVPLAGSGHARGLGAPARVAGDGVVGKTGRPRYADQVDLRARKGSGSAHGGGDDHRRSDDTPGHVRRAGRCWRTSRRRGWRRRAW